MAVKEQNWKGTRITRTGAPIANELYPLIEAWLIKHSEEVHPIHLAGIADDVIQKIAMDRDLYRKANRKGLK